MVEAHGRQATIHFALEDAAGDSAIIEFAGGEPVIHHGRQYTIMTNDPTYDEQLALIAQQDFSHPSQRYAVAGQRQCGRPVPARRLLQRAATRAGRYPAGGGERDGDHAQRVRFRSARPYAEFGVYNTEYRTVIDLTEKLYFFELSTSPNVIWIDFDALKLDDQPMEINPYDTTLVGDVTARFQPQPVPF